MLTDIREQHRESVRLCRGVVARVAPHRLADPTPCAEWDLRDLLHHMAVQNRGFAAAAAGHGKEYDWWRKEFADDPIADCLSSCDEVVTAFAAEGVLDRPWSLPDITTDTTIPGSTAINFHLVDSVVHAWDVARAIGEQIDIDPDLAAISQRIADKVPTGSIRIEPGAAFGPDLPTTAEDSALDRTLRLLGRSPSWPDPTPGQP
ncbi:TIGR03086 family protein [Nocardia cyriacigeorgica]|uniref:TIGR03086 family protein n=1 Tax=Nocardia cyriacigeorgica TaxID=135487 RepID=A0A6P1D5K0_9NOCA|nr:TIGR03086 family metal-binding protein [Nocardia cyriacigeorgica]NEW40844.1 TIGR03086 family protein [Nocardia cyriacigeorgica]NEW45915.1 TIGR03086 family protein [Nocardia cyriacigeorgica]NEW50946.1 TIGR03086 family protein [Nocardia cyriacigeorgica]NEW55686.1 TIGR03086 family protein [Nocardia cyriacigeorgica]